LFWFGLIVVIVRLVNTLLFSIALKNARTYELSGLISSIVNIIIYIVSFFLIFQTQFPNVNLGAIFTTSTIIGVVIGLALQDTLGNLFAGFAIQADQPFQIGDVVTIPNKGMGVVESISWRGVKMRTFQNKLLVISNSVLGKEAIEVAPRGNLNARIVNFNTLYTNSPAKTIQVIRDVVRQVENVSPKIRPVVRIGKLAPDGLEWEIKYWAEDYSKFNDTDAAIRQNIWYAFQREKIDFAYPTRTVYMHSEAPARAFVENPDDIFERLNNIPIFTPLCPEEIQSLSKSSSIRVFAPKEAIVRKGQKGTSMFVIHRGTVNILIEEAGRQQIVGSLSEGDFFGEMGLFTGEERTADVVAETETKVLEIRSRSLKPILENNPELVKSISEIIESRRAELDKQQSETKKRKKSADGGVVNSIRKFFGLKG
jgi:small-conductance mechanosensitive channel